MWIIRDVADSRKAGIFKRDTACFHRDSMNCDFSTQWIAIKTCSIPDENSAVREFTDLQNRQNTKQQHVLIFTYAIFPVWL